ncbi:hypothetical protein MPTK1_1g21960 [Marchantia polymorpha subsp. ruderalis]|uniref:Protein LOW PSII ACCUMULATION 1, chloroplastic n=2 Tax=Marchantia polymorpha TaxID=3197 RepID=A0AAF6ASX9_MARPO|nr:hypothetical protein MARPO_0001s0532 [Marchantia polymorpha]BBM99549.1 hypothetical protein Mp_1g21960 [Marchantia polymorpha subsp. ruderalis]|eukprot:PTQ50632.1 hypothetical protein MARPO_0001s0532 [Marchantia polymorpha]
MATMLQFRHSACLQQRSTVVSSFAPGSSLQLARHKNSRPKFRLLRFPSNAACVSRKRHRCLRIRSAGKSDSDTIASENASSAATAKEAVELGLAQFAKGRVKEALDHFNAALKLNPAPEEAQAALYNKACCHAVRGEGTLAAQALRKALKEHDLKFSVILNDPDMAAFRAMPEFKELQDEARKGGEAIGNSFRRDLKLISEVQAPFRGVRKFFYVAFSLAAGISTLFTLPRLILAIQGGDGAPGIPETAQNLAINLGGIAAFVALYIWDNKKEEEQISRISRDETLSRLAVQLQSNRIVELTQLRQSTRPVIIAGSKETVAKAVQKAARYRDDLLKRGVLVVPIVWGGDKEDPMLKKRGFGAVQKPTTSNAIPAGDDFEKKAEDVAAKAVIQAERRFKAEAVSPGEWERWIRDQQASEGVTPGEDVYIVLRLDGRVRKSGRGMPEWIELVNELAPLDSVVSRLEK